MTTLPLTERPLPGRYRTFFKERQDSGRVEIFAGNIILLNNLLLE
jgi:hypothetical protein